MNKLATRLFLFGVLGFIAQVGLTTPSWSQTTYTWNQTGSAPWTTAANWTPTRTTPATNDVLVINGSSTPSPTVTNVRTETIGRLLLTNSANATLTSAAAVTITISGGSGSDLDIASGSSLALSGANAIAISLSTGATGSVAGSIAASGGAHRLLAADASGITFQSGGSFATGTGFTGNAFGTANLNSIVFANGSTYTHNAGSNPFWAAAPSSVVVFQSGSTAVIRTGTGFSASGRTYANLTIQNTTSVNSTGNSNSFQCQTLSVESGSSFALACSLSASITITGDIIAGGSGNISLTGGSGGIVINSGSTQTFGSGGGTGTITFGSSATIGGGTTVSLARGLILSSGTLTVNGTLDGGLHAITGGGNFTLSSGATLKTAHGSGVNGAIQTTGTNTLSTSATYEFNGSGAQVTGSLMPTTIYDLTVNNTAVVALSQSTTTYSTLTIGADAELIVGSSMTLTGGYSHNIDGKLSGIDASSSIVLLQGTSYRNITFPSSVPGATVKSVKIRTSDADCRVAFSGICNLQSGASFEIDNSSTLMLSGGAEVGGGTINVTNGQLWLHDFGSQYTLTLSAASLIVNNVSFVYGPGTVATVGASTIDQRGTWTQQPFYTGYPALEVWSGATKAMGVFDGPVTVKSYAVLNTAGALEGGLALTVSDDMMVESDASVGGGKTLTLSGSSDTYTNGGTISPPTTIGGGPQNFIAGDGTWSNLTIDELVTVYLDDNTTLTNSNVTLRGTLSTQDHTLSLNGGTFVIESTGTVNGGGLTVETQGTLSITQNGTFDETLHVLGGTTTASGTNSFDREIIVDEGATLYVPEGDSLIVNSDLTVSGWITGGNAASSLKLRGRGEGWYSVTLNDAVVSNVNVELDHGTRSIAGSGTFTGATVKIDGGSGLKLNGDLTVTGGTIQLGWCDIDLYGYLLTLDGGTLTVGGSADVMSTAEVSGRLVTKGATTIDQGGTFSVPLEVNSGTTTASGAESFFGDITVRGGATLTVPATMTQDGGALTVETDATIAGSGSFIYFGWTTFENNGTISVATTLEEGEGDPHILGDGTWSNLTIPSGTVVYVDADMAMRSSSVTNQGWLVIDDYAFTFDGGTFTNEGTVSSEWDSFECEGDVTLTQNGTFAATLVVNSGTTTTSGTYSDPIIVKPGGVLSIPGGETLAAEAKVIVERASASSYGTIGGAGSLAFSAYRDTLTNDGAVSASTIFENVEGGLYYIAGNGAWGDVFIEPYVEVKLSGNVAMENANLTIEGIGSLNTQWNTLLLKGTSAVNVEVQPSASITGGGVTVQTQGIVNIVQNGTFDESLQVLGGTTTAEGQFQKLIIVHDGATLTIPATKTLTATDSVRVDGGTTGGAITGAGSLMFYGYRRTFTNDGLVSAPTTFVDNDGDWKKIDGTGYWSSLTIAGRCSTNVGYTLILTGAPTPLTVGISLQTSGQTIIYKGTSPQTVAPIPYNNLEINNSAGASLGAASAVGGNLALTSGQFNVGSNLTLGSGASITRKVGSLTGTPTFGSSIDVSYIGTVAVTTGPEIPNASTTLIGLTINNSGGVTLGSPVTVNGTLSVAGGNLITAADTVKLAEFATITETAPYSVLGKLNTARTCTTFAAQDFGGMGLEIGPASVAPGLTKVTRVTGAASTLPTGPSILRYFDISPATNTGLGATMVFHYRDPQDLNGRDESKFVLFKSTNSATTWTAQACTLDASANRITMYGVGSFSRWTAGESYPVPTLTSISPTSGSLGGTLNVNLTGSGYVAGATTVYFDTSITVNSVTVNSDTSLTANITISAGTSAGLRNVSVTNPSPGGGTGTLPSAFNVIAGNPIPTLSSIAPTTVGLGATANIVLTGTGFANGISTPSFGGDITVNSFTVNSPTQITANITVSSSASLGARNVSVTNVPPGGGTGTLTNGLTLEYPAPAIGSITPNSASRGQTLAVTIIGEGYFSGVTAVNFGPNVIVNSMSISSTTQLTANITIGAAASTGLRSVTVSNSSPGGGSTTWENAFTINNPTPALSSVSPTSGSRGQTLTVVLRGSNFVSGLSTVSFGPDITVNSTTVDSASKMTVGITIGPGAATGSRDVTVTHPAPGGGTATLAGGFAVGNPSPTLASVTPTIAGRGETINVTLTGLNFINGVSSASFGAGITVNSTAVNSATQMTVNITIGADAALGSRDVTVNNTAPGGGTSTLSGGFTVNNPAPTLASITPTSGNRGQTLSVTVTGTNFIPGVTTPAYGSGITVNSVSSFTSTQVTASVTIDVGATPGPRDITVTNAAPGGGSATLSGAFTVTNPSPTLTSILPNRAGRGSRINVVVTGTNFLDGVSSASFGSDVTVNSTTITSATQITVNISVALSAATGARNVSVTNATPGGGTATLTGGFTVDTSPATSVENTLSAIPEEYVLQEAYPNPFNPSTRIRYGLPEQSRVKLEVYNMLGNVVAELVSGERSKGLYEVEWRAENLPSGVYLVRVFSESVETSKRFIASRKVVLVK